MKAPYGMTERLAIALIAVFANALPALAQIAADDGDILDGQQYLVRSDDLLVADPGFVSGSADKTEVQYFPLETEDMLITTSEAVGATKLVELSCTASSPTNVPFPQQTQTMRMFNLPNDVVLTLAPTAGVTGTGCANQSNGAMTFYVDDPGTGDSYKFVVSGDIRNRWPHTAAADFDGDCEDDADCPSTGVTSCSDADKQQLYVQYDGATSVASSDNDGGALEWYQPIHEPGQVLSYPWDCDQLASRNDVNICDGSDGSTLLSEATAFATDTSSQTYSLSWSIGSGQSRTASKGGQFSQKLTETVSASTPQLESQIAGAELKESVSINANEAIGTSKTNSTTLGSSTGVTVARSGTFLSRGKFSYTVDGYIFGDAPKPGQLER